MTTIHISLPDDLAATARDAGLLNAEVIQGLLQQELRRQALGDLRQAWADMEPAELTAEIEQEIVDAVRQCRAELRQERPVG
jgi:post-segregation antitoxin (ccd killing protein)